MLMLILLGRLCDQCVDGYAQRDNKCEKCDCNGNIDPNSIGNCNITGQCLKCIFNTWGGSCERCLPGHYGSALVAEKGNCRACGCDPFGTIPEEHFDEFHEAKRQGYLRSFFNTDTFFSCNSINGQCRCKPNVAGRQCDSCIDGYWDLGPNEGCKACNCDPVGAENRLCRERDGQCHCKPGVTGKQCDKCLPDHYGFGPDGCQKCECDPIGSTETQCDVISGQCSCRTNVEGKRCEFCQENKYNKEAGCIDCPPCYSLVQESVAVHRANISELKQLLDEIEQDTRTVDDSKFETQLQEMMENVRRLYDTAKDSQGKDNSLKFQLEEIKARLRKVQETTKKIDSQLNSISPQIEYGMKNISIAKDIVRTAETELNNALNYLNMDGKRSLEKAKHRSEKYGHQSDKMSKTAVEARTLADKHEEESKRIIDQFKDIRIKSETAYNMAKDAINNQKANKDALDELKRKLLKVKNQYEMTEKLADDVQRHAKVAQDESLSLLTEVSNIKVPMLKSNNYKEEANRIIHQVGEAKKEADKILKTHEELLNSTENRLQDTKALFEDAQRQQQTADKLLMEVDAALNQTNEAVRTGDNILKEAEQTLKTLQKFDSNVQSSKSKADEALNRVPQINADIEEAIRKAAAEREKLDQAFTEAINSRDIASSAKQIANADLKESQSIREDAQQTKNKMNELQDKSQSLLKEVERTSNRMTDYENQAESDEKLVLEALKQADTAKTSATEAIRKANNATGELDNILRDLSKIISL